MSEKIKTVTMDKIEFQDLPSEETPISAENLNQVQSNVEDAVNEAVLTEDDIFDALFEVVDEW